MSNGPLLLAIPSAVVLVALVIHSLRCLPRRRALAFWVSVLAYGFVRGIAVRLVTERGLSASFPYVFHEQRLAVLGVGLQELAGWALVAYLGWWLGCRWARAAAAPGRARLFVQVAWACVFLAAASWAVESAAAAAGWWHWTIPASHALLGPVPAIGLIDWSLVAVDFLLPFVACSAPSLRGRTWRFATLLAFPLHFAAHLVPAGSSATLPSLFGLVHAGLFLGLIAVLGLSRAEDDAFDREDARVAWLQVAAIGVVAGTLLIAVVQAGRVPEFLAPIAVLLATALFTTRLWPHLATMAAAAGLARIEATFLFAAVPSLLSLPLRWLSRGGPARAAVAVGVAAITLVVVHFASAASEARFREALDAAIAARDRGDLSEAVRRLESLTRTGPRSHVPHALLGEIYYRTDRLAEASVAFEEAVAIQPAHVEGHRYLAVIALRGNSSRAAREHARRGLLVRPADLELEYLAACTIGSVPAEIWDRALAQGPRSVSSLAALAFEVGRTAEAVRAVDAGLRRWPADSDLLRKKQQLRRGGG